jgi:uncharacterized protein (DUF1330 family)
VPAYLVLQSTVKDETQYQKYAQAVWPLMVRYGAKIVARRGQVEILEGEHDQRPVSMFEFPDMEAIRAFWISPEYIPVKMMREGIATLDLGFSGSLIGTNCWSLADLATLAGKSLAGKIGPTWNGMAMSANDR